MFESEPKDLHFFVRRDETHPQEYRECVGPLLAARGAAIGAVALRVVTDRQGLPQ